MHPTRVFPRSPLATGHALVLTLTALALAACGASESQPRGLAPVAGSAGVTPPALQTVRSEHGAVAAASVWAAEAGAQILAEGGNAADAAVAAAWVLAVTEPSMSGVGGRSAIVIRTAEGQVTGIDDLNQVPASYREGVAPGGYDRVAIPGVPAALGRLHAEHGTLPMARLLAPAIRLAEEGFELPEPEAARMAGARDDLLLHPEALGTYLQPDGTPWPAGVLFRQPKLARTLRAMAAEGVEVFYRGWVADSIDADMRRTGGFVTREELTGYEALRALPVEGRYRGHTILSNFRPASGHAVIQALQTLEVATPEGIPARTPVEAARWAALVGQTMGQAIDERNRGLGDNEAEMARLLTSRSHAEARARELRIPGAAEAASGGGAGEPGRADPSFRLEFLPLATPEGATAPGFLITDPRDRESTTHLTAMDGSGMIVSLTQSLGPSMGARVVAPGLGFLYATRLGNTPGSRPGSTIAPTLVLRPDGTLLAGLGGAGDARIISAVIQTISRMLDHGMPLDEAMRAPRVHPDGALRLRVEEAGGAGWDGASLRALEGWGFELLPSPPGYFGRVHAVGWEPARGEAFGVAEPRWDGGASAPLRAPGGAR